VKNFGQFLKDNPRSGLLVAETGEGFRGQRSDVRDRGDNPRSHVSYS
jgi:hypothetical protein